MSPAAGLVVVDKPAGITSHDVVRRCRRIFATRKVGHAGTLDPMATGVLVVGIERATKILGLLTATDKSYAATIRLGQATATDDAEGDVLQSVSASWPHRRPDRRCRGRAARRDRPGPVGGQRRQGRRRAGLPARAGRPGRRTGPPAACASTGSTCWPSGDTTNSSMLTSRWTARRVPTSARWPAMSARRSASAATSPRCGAPASDASGWTRPAPSTNSRSSRACPTPSTRRACWSFRVAT